MIVCGKHGQQNITTTENFYNETVFTLACRCRGTVAELAEGWPAAPEPGPLTSEQMAAFVAQLSPEQAGELRGLLPPPAETAQAELEHIDEIKAPTLAEAVTAALAEPPAEIPPATPAAVAHADELGVDLTKVEGSGVDGKILKADFEAVAPAAEGEGTDGSANG